MKRILFDINEFFNQVAYVEDNILVEYHIEKQDDKSILGNIYKGKVQNVLKGMQSAFIDIGIGRNAYISINDLIYPRSISNEPKSITKIIRPGQDIMVQVVKEAVGLKSAKATANISLPGKYVVLVPGSDYIGISHRIQDEGIKKNLIDISKELKPDGVGLIIRTAASNADKSKFKRDIIKLIAKYDDIKDKYELVRSPQLIYEEQNFILKYIRDMSSYNVDEIIINDNNLFKKSVEYLKREDFNTSSIKYEDGDIYGAYGIDSQIEKLLNKKVWLKSGGFLIIDKTEALTVIDVNTGKYTGNSSLNETIFNTNIEAAKEIALQLRLRDIGGIIIIDFIDMESDVEKEKLLNIFKDNLTYDRSKCNIMGFTNLGLVEMTRKRVRSNVSAYMVNKCTYCHGNGYVISNDYLLLKIKRDIDRINSITNAKKIYIKANDSVKSLIEESNIVERYKDINNLQISTILDKKMAYGKFEITYDV